MELKEKDSVSTDEILKDIESLPEEQRDAIVSTVVQEYSYSGVLPHPMLLKQFDDVLPGTAERIITMTEKEGEHRRQIEKKIVNSEFSIQRLGIFCGLIVSLVGMSGSIYLGLKGMIIPSGVLGGGTLVSLVGVFITGINVKNDK